MGSKLVNLQWVMRDTMMEGSRLILTTWGFLMFTQTTVYKNFCVLLPPQCGCRYQKLNLRPHAQHHSMVDTELLQGVHLTVKMRNSIPDNQKQNKQEQCKLSVIG